MAINETNQRRMFGGLNWGASFFGWLVATAVAVLLTALISAAGGAVALTNGANYLTAGNVGTVGVMSAIALLIAFAIAYYAGGYVAGRMSRFDGGRQGFGVWVVGIIAAIVLAAAGVLLGSAYNLLQQVNLPHIPVNEGAFTVGGWVTLILLLGVTLLSAIGGAVMGENYHRRVDAAGLGMEADEPVYTEPVETAMPTRTQPTFGERIERIDRRDRRDRRG